MIVNVTPAFDHRHLEWYADKFNEELGRTVFIRQRIYEGGSHELQINQLGDKDVTKVGMLLAQMARRKKTPAQFQLPAVDSSSASRVHNQADHKWARAILMPLIEHARSVQRDRETVV